MNEAIQEKLPRDLVPKVEVRYMTIPRKIKIVLQKNNKDLKITLPAPIQAIFGFDTDAITETTVAACAADLSALVHSMYAYSNIISPRIVGDSLVPLLRVMAIHGTHNEYVMESFYHLQYIPVRLRNFRSIEIDLRNNIGESMPFHSGEAILTLHFRRALR